jgi:ADP-heptose:LPS heptosyltransferase
MFADAGIKCVLFDVCTRWHKEIQTHSNLDHSIARPWPETIGKILACDLVITPDSGFYHLTGCFKKRTLGLFGCTSGQIMSETWNWDVRTHEYLQLRHDEIDYTSLPKGKIPCQPICYMRWERGWEGDRYRKQGQYCSLMLQLQPDRVFQKVMEILGENKCAPSPQQ